MSKSPLSSAQSSPPSADIFLGLAATLVIWLVGLAALAFVVQPSVVIVFGRTAPLLADPQLKIVAMRPGIVTVAGGGRGWVRRLYADGAWFVWPIDKGGCVGRNRLTK